MTDQEKQPLKGLPALAKMAEAIAKQASGKSGEQSTESNKVDWRKEAEEAESRALTLARMKAMSGGDEIEKQRTAKQEKDDAERKAAVDHAQKLEDEKNQHTQGELDEAKRTAQEEAAERKRLEEEKRSADRAALEQKQVEMTEKFNQAMQANSPESFLKNYRTWKELQRELDPEEKSGGGTDPTIAIELKKLELQQSKDEREFKWKMRQDDKEFQLALQKMEDDREFRKQEIAQQAKKDAMWASTPERVGRMFGKTVLEGTEEGISAPATKQKSGGQAYHIEIGEGEAGEVPCPNCDTPVGVGQSSKGAVCVGCGNKFRIDRKSSETAPAEEEV